MDIADLDLTLPPGLVAVTGDEGAGKTRLLRRLAGDLPTADGLAATAEVCWADLALPGLDEQTPLQVWAQWRQRFAAWNAGLQEELAQALGLTEHQGKKLLMLSTGSRRKTALVGLLSCGARITCLDQPFGALDAASARVIREFLLDMADHPSRTWVVADYEADPRLPWARHIGLPAPAAR